MKYHPNIVLMGFCSVDTLLNLLGSDDYWNPRFAVRSGKLVLTHVLVPRPEEVLREEIYRSKLLDLGLILWHRFRELLGLEQEEAPEITAAIFDEMVATCHRIGATLVFADLPVYDHVWNTREAMSPNELFLSQYCESRHLRCDRPLSRQQPQANLKTGCRANPPLAVVGLAQKSFRRRRRGSLFFPTLAGRPENRTCAELVPLAKRGNPGLVYKHRIS